jgi:(p)ppGpp synthase/HD superfamily hydrolase
MSNPPSLTPIDEKARDFAIKAHGNMTRKFSNVLYINHPIEIAARLKTFNVDRSIIAAAYLHDVVEDTNVKIDVIYDTFGEEVANLVKEMTSDKVLAKQIGKAIYLTERINHMSSQARLLKLADRENNVKGLQEDPQDFALRYAEETSYILTHLEFSPSTIEQEFIDSIWKYIRPFLP